MPSEQYLAMIAIVVDDYDQAIQWYTEKLDFKLLEDTRLSETKRWVVVSPGNNSGCKILLARAANEAQTEHIGNQTGGRVFLFLHTSEFDTFFKTIVSRGVEIVRGPALEDFGQVAVFKDLYGNLWDLIEPKN
jgi:catechol 2,3-dioxygenase-like lactoylglutathione lyase family enzyme